MPCNSHDALIVRHLKEIHCNNGSPKYNLDRPEYQIPVWPTECDLHGYPKEYQTVSELPKWVRNLSACEKKVSHLMHSLYTVQASPEYTSWTLWKLRHILNCAHANSEDDYSMNSVEAIKHSIQRNLQIERLSEFLSARKSLETDLHQYSEQLDDVQQQIDSVLDEILSGLEELADPSNLEMIAESLNGLDGSILEIDQQIQDSEAKFNISMAQLTQLNQDLHIYINKLGVDVSSPSDPQVSGLSSPKQSPVEYTDIYHYQQAQQQQHQHLTITTPASPTSPTEIIPTSTSTTSTTPTSYDNDNRVFESNLMDLSMVCFNMRTLLGNVQLSNTVFFADLTALVYAELYGLNQIYNLTKHEPGSSLEIAASQLRSQHIGIYRHCWSIQKHHQETITRLLYELEFVKSQIDSANIKFCEVCVQYMARITNSVDELRAGMHQPRYLLDQTHEDLKGLHQLMVACIATTN